MPHPTSSPPTRVRPLEPYDQRIARLSRRSVTKHFDAYADIDWEHPAFAVDPEDCRWECSAQDPLGQTDWYMSLPQPVRARLGLHLIVMQMKTGAFFENVLSRGLLEFATTLDETSPELRYAYHELIEESQHTLMFHEFIRRSRLEALGPKAWERVMSRRVASLGRRFPELFFLFVLGGEVPIDRLQRRTLERRDALHPLLRRVMQIHVTEEARHVSFAQSFLEQRVPRLSRARRLRLALTVPFILHDLAARMLVPPDFIVRRYAIPAGVVRSAYRENPEQRRRVQEGLEPVRALCHKLGLCRGSALVLWKGLGLWPDAATPPPSERLGAVPGIVGAVPRHWLGPREAVGRPETSLSGCTPEAACSAQTV
jgi:hypothetical protein